MPDSPSDLEDYRDELGRYFARCFRRREASKAYNDRNREVRNAKKRERMAALRASRVDEAPELAQARRLAARESAQTYRESHREVLAKKARRQRRRAKRQAATVDA
ncbi:hypothetical protein C8R46DRAFT_1359011 [Mycena filopes]|nr:hypothetical protein C8R46DRAFT_1359011 [Mycena filopes]